jgi:hypothetical protein
MNPSRPSDLSGLGEEVKLYELQFETQWSVLGGRGWGDLELMLLTRCEVAKRENILQDRCYKK